jgi:hypothetical protein
MEIEDLESVIADIVRELKDQGTYIDKAATGKSNVSNMGASDVSYRTALYLVRGGNPQSSSNWCHENFTAIQTEAESNRTRSPLRQVL